MEKDLDFSFLAKENCEERTIKLKNTEIVVFVTKDNKYNQTRTMTKEEAEIFFSVMNKNKIPCKIKERICYEKCTDNNGNINTFTESSTGRSAKIAVTIGVIDYNITDLLDKIKEEYDINKE